MSLVFMTVGRPGVGGDAEFLPGHAHHGGGVQGDRQLPHLLRYL